MSLLIILVTIVVAFFLAMPISILLHEFGHAIPALLLTKGKVEMFIGSRGDKTKSFKIKIGLLDIWITKNPLAWKSGLCRQMTKNIPLKSQIIYIAGGPFVSLLVGIVGLICLIHFFPNKVLRYCFLFFTYYSIAIFLSSIIPRNKKNGVSNGNVIYNDGYILRRLFKVKKFHKEFDDATKLYNTQQYEEASRLCEFLLDKRIDYVAVFQNGISACIMARNYERALQLCNKYQKDFVLTTNDYCHIGMAKLFSKMYLQAKADFEKSLALDANNIYSLNNIGYNYILTNEHEKAIPYLDNAILLNAAFATAYANRGLAKAKLGKTVDGLNDLDKAIELDQSNACVYRNLGMYYHDIGNYAKALSFYNKAFEIDSNTHLITDLIRQAEDCLNKTAPSTASKTEPAPSQSSL
jgi:tetratricopeptide (TPR) repeat protein